ncbi:MAG: hypothetical protein ABIQ31_02915 [Ferruginibacter sp.]
MKWCLLISIVAFAFYSTNKNTDMITNARKAARLFCTKNNYPADKIREITGEPLVSVDTEKHGRQVHIYRWLGNGRGESYVQVEVFKDKKEMIVYGANGDKEINKETYPLIKEE